MTQHEIRRRQGPLREMYKFRPENAVISFTASGTLGENGTCLIQDGEFFREAGLHPASGGSGIHLWPGNMFLESVVACIGITLNSIASTMNIILKQANITAEGEIDFKGTLGVSEEAPVGFRSLKVKFDIDSDADENEIRNLIALTEQYCVLYQTLKNTPEIEVTLRDEVI